MTTVQEELGRLLSSVQSLTERLDGRPLESEQATGIYQAFCIIGEMLGPAIAAHLVKECSDEDLQNELAEGIHTGPGRERSAAIRAYNSAVVARLLFDLTPTVSGAFHSGEQTVQAIVNDLVGDDPPLELKKPQQRPRGAGGWHYRRQRELARATLYEIVVYEAARNEKAEERTFNELIENAGSRTGETRWRDLKRGQKTLRADFESVSQALRDRAIQTRVEHEKLHLLSNQNFWRTLGL
ncbi:hypothetical protein M2281_001612 [Mesorhizobium soli]|uniref:hypothetical protein n=1 Tax=Pseudaminobacter soli (ex Li et al. 2025) TaxID=1295366 RepID=UPI002473560C|nr:hypothetical protein [Mesorhizobium soli]MDH6231040.1 hypothetical protein [Mesorhizobium soli]